MNKTYYWIALLCVSLLSFTACGESNGVDEYANWQQRNQSYLDFIAQQANDNPGNEVGQWKKIKSYLLEPDQIGNGSSTPSSISNYVYARINLVGNGKTPVYTDSVYICYRGSMINGTLFDKTATFVPKNCNKTDTLFLDKPNDSYGDLFRHVVYFPDMELVEPTKSITQKFIVGWITALQEMREGDYWTLYIPAELAYGSSGSTDKTIPGNSTLIFDLYLDKVVQR